MSTGPSSVLQFGQRVHSVMYANIPSPIKGVKQQIPRIVSRIRDRVCNLN